MYGITTLLDKNINTFAHTHLIIKILNQMHYKSWIYPCCALALFPHLLPHLLATPSVLPPPYMPAFYDFAEFACQYQSLFGLQTASRVSVATTLSAGDHM